MLDRTDRFLVAAAGPQPGVLGSEVGVLGAARGERGLLDAVAGDTCRGGLGCLRFPESLRAACSRLPARMTPGTSLPDEALSSARLLADWGERRAWRGSDPYEGLNATRLIGPFTRTALGRRVVIQAVKRSPMNLRPVLGIPPRRNAAALASVVSAYAVGGPDLVADWEPRLDRAVELLMELRSPGYQQPCWGYHFDVQTRVFFYPSHSPNAIATVFAGFALLDAFERTQDEQLLAIALQVGEFFLEHVPQTPDPPGAYFGYLPSDRSPIHNANMLVCALLARLGAHAERERERLWTAVRAGVAYTLERQRDDGSWPYGERPNLGWVDNFHTGYVLECLMTCSSAGLAIGASALTRGLSYARRELFLADGTPKYFPHAVYPIDSQSVAQAIQTFSIAARHWPELGEQASQTWAFARDNMRRRDGAFVFQRGRGWSNPIPHVRWAQAPMLLALTHLGLSRPAGCTLSQLGDARLHPRHLTPISTDPPKTSGD